MAVAPHILLERDMCEPELHGFAGGEACLFSTRAPHKNGPNEDGIALLPWSNGDGALVIADGLGGHAGGVQACAVALRCLADTVRRGEASGATLRESILDGMERANRAVTDLGIGAGTTLAVMELSGGVARPYHVGDSMILVTGQRGRSKLQTVPHSPTGYAVEAGYMDVEEAMRHEDRHIVSNMVGTSDMRIEIGAPIKLAHFDTVLLASDGLSDNLHAEEIIERVRVGKLDGVGKLLIDLSHERMANNGADQPSKSDDLSFIVYRLGARHRHSE